MRKLVIATQNRDKFQEIKAALANIGWDLLPGSDFPGMPDVEEDGTTLEENSYKKAWIASAFTGFAALSDDTGLFVDALQGQPGIYAARFAGIGCRYEDNVEKLLGLMKNVPTERRTATFRTVITICYPGGSFQQVSGEVMGFIAGEPKGRNGFGYDPVFQPAGSSNVFAEMLLEEKNKVGHRGLAIQKARQLLGNN